MMSTAADPHGRRARLARVSLLALVPVALAGAGCVQGPLHFVVVESALAGNSPASPATYAVVPDPTYASPAASRRAAILSVERAVELAGARLAEPTTERPDVRIEISWGVESPPADGPGGESPEESPDTGAVDEDLDAARDRGDPRPLSWLELVGRATDGGPRGRVLWRTVAIAHAETRDLERMLPVLSMAMVPWWGQASDGIRRVRVAEEDGRVRVLRSRIAAP